MKRTGFFRSFGCALKGIAATIRGERNIKVQLAVAVVALALGAVVLREPLEWAVVILCCGCVIGAELINTAIEHVVDLVSPEWNELAGKAKDAAAGGGSGHCPCSRDDWRDRLCPCVPAVDGAVLNC